MNELIKSIDSIDSLIDDLFFFPYSSIFKSKPSEVFTNKLINYPYDVYYDKDIDSFVIEIALAGFSKSDIKINIDDDKLTISGEIHAKVTPSGEIKTIEDNKNIEYYHKGISRRGFSITFTLRSKIKIDEVEGDFENGLLKVILPRESHKKKIKIK